MKIRRLPSSGQRPKTCPAELVSTSAPMPVPVVSGPLTRRGGPQLPFARRWFMKTGAPLCQMAYSESRNGEPGQLSISTICLSVSSWPPEIVLSKVHEAPPSVDLNKRNLRPPRPSSMPIVLDQAVPSEVQPTVGSLFMTSSPISSSVVCPQVTPPSVDQYCA